MMSIRAYSLLVHGRGWPDYANSLRAADRYDPDPTDCEMILGDVWFRKIRGGSWCHDAGWLRAKTSFDHSPVHYWLHRGFRCVRNKT